MYPKDFRYWVIPVSDTLEGDLFSYFAKGILFIEKGLKKGTGVLVHCYAGVSRSASMIIAYLMVKYQKGLTAAQKMVRDKRPIIKPNESFIEQLQQFECYDYDFKTLILAKHKFKSLDTSSDEEEETKNENNDDILPVSSSIDINCSKLLESKDHKKEDNDTSSCLLEKYQIKMTKLSDL